MRDPLGFGTLLSMQRNDLIVVYGSDPAAMVREALVAARIEELIPLGALIALKPNLVVSKPASSGATPRSGHLPQRATPPSCTGSPAWRKRAF